MESLNWLPRGVFVPLGQPHSSFDYCKRGNFRVGVIFAFFALLPSSRKLPPRENKTHMPL